MKRKVVILPIDGEPSAASLISKLEKLLKSEKMRKLLAYIKVNDGVHNPDLGGPTTVSKIKKVLRENGLSDVKVFLDLKIVDVSATVKNVLAKYQLFKPGIVTISASCNVSGIIELRKLLPETQFALVSIPTDWSDEQCQFFYGQSPSVKIYNDLMNIRTLYKKEVEADPDLKDTEPFDLIVSSEKEVSFLEKNVPESYGFIIPGVRDEWMKKANEHQKRITGVKKALSHGNRVLVVMGAQLTAGNPQMGVSPEESQEFTFQEIELAQANQFENPLDVLKACGGYYKCPQDKEGTYLGPIVAYKGTYEVPGGQTKNKVGFKYYDFASVEDNSLALDYFAKVIGKKMKEREIKCDVVLGAAMGGIKLSDALGRELKCRSIFTEKEIITLADAAKGLKEESRQILGRHNIYADEGVVIVEDVTNNFSTTEDMIKLVEERGGHVSCIVCGFNRSSMTAWNDIPVISALDIPTNQYKQEDAVVSGFVARGEVIWKPKLNRFKLQEEMKKDCLPEE